MLKTKGYSLWLMPSGEVYNRLNDLISELSGKYSTPDFEPHVTLLGKVEGDENEILEKTAQLARLLQPYRVELKGIGYLDEYTRCLFLRVRETDEVMRANREARKVFGRETDSKYMPHLSLMYGDFPPQTKEEIITEIGKEFDLGFDVESLHLFSIEDEPKDWHEVEEFSLK